MGDVESWGLGDSAEKKNILAANLLQKSEGLAEIETWKYGFETD